MEKFRSVSELLRYCSTLGIDVVPNSVIWHDGDIIESDDVEFDDDMLVIAGKVIDADKITIETFVNGYLMFTATEMGTDYIVSCFYDSMCE